MAGKRVPLLVGFAVVGTTLLTATALGAVTQGGSRTGHIEMAAGLTSSVTQNGIQVKAAAGSARVPSGAEVALTVMVSSESAQTTVVELEAYDPAGRRVFQRFWPGETLAPGRSSTWRTTWTAPAGAGRYRIAVGVFTQGWGSLLAWNNRAAFVVVAPTEGEAAVAPGAEAAAPTADSPVTGTSAHPTAAGRAAPAAGAPGAPTAHPDATTPAGPPKGAPSGEPATPTTPSPTTKRAPSGPGHFATLVVGATLPTDEQCTALVHRLPTPAETKAGNARPNATPGRPIAAATGLMARIDGNFTGTTEQILRWTACKWGIDEDVVKAQAAVESWWRMDTKGDWGTDPARCPPGHGPGTDGRDGSCPESWGLMQVRYPNHQAAYPLAMTSTAFNADYAFAQWRDCYLGNSTWLNTVEHGRPYAAGDAWGCVGVWFAGRWHTAAADAYIAKVKGYLDQKIWTTSDFQQS